MNPRNLTGRWLAILIVVGMLHGQQMLERLPRFDFFGSYTPMGDMDGDGYEDVLVTRLIHVPIGPSSYDYEFRFYSGRTRALLRVGPRWTYPHRAWSFPTGDHNNDGIRDYICRDSAAANALMRVSVRSGRDDSIFWMQQKSIVDYWAQDLIGDLDIDGDGLLDVVATHPTSTTGFGKIWAYDHLGNEIYSVVGTGTIQNQYLSLGQSLAKLGDVNNDGRDDYIVGLGDPTWYGAVGIFSGADGQLLRIVYGQNFRDYIGGGCVGCGDLDGDGLPDFAAGGGLSSSWGSVQAFSSATGQRLFATYSGYHGDRFGRVLRAADYDHDGIQDIIAAAWSGFRVVSGRDGSFLHQPDSPWTGWFSGGGVFDAQPLFTPDRFPNFIVSTVSTAYAMSSLPHGSKVLGTGCAMSSGQTPPHLGMLETGWPDTLVNRRVTLSGAEADTVAFLMLGLGNSGQPHSLAPYGLPACFVYPDVAVISAFVTGKGGIASGYAHHDFHAAHYGIRGIALEAQWLTLDGSATPAGLSEAMRFVIRP